MSVTLFLHFSNKNLDNPNNDKLVKVQPQLKFFVPQFQLVYEPEKCISIDKELVAWWGELQFRQYIPSKCARSGIGLFGLYMTSGYISNFIVYAGKDSRLNVNDNIRKRFRKSSAIVSKLFQPYANKGHHLYLDNWYNSIELAIYLKE